mmetsp:Transcript_12580/g.41709  ORF Transcript_12580/g.41709 Transcript_12580/m.41709 type:complete len:258 (-) Transcript_12580:280-1053(-)
MSELREATACVRAAWLVPYVSPLAREVIHATSSSGASVQIGTPAGPDDTSTFSFKESGEWCLERLRDGSADVWIESNTIAKPVALRHCPSTSSDTAFVLAPAISFGQSAYSFAMRSEDEELANHLSAANIFYGLQHPSERQELEQRWFDSGKSCPAVTLAEVSRIEFAPFAGVFVVFAALAIAGLLAGAATWACRVSRDAANHGEASRAEDMYTDAPTNAAGVPKALLARLDAMEDQMKETLEETRALFGKGEDEGP